MSTEPVSLPTPEELAAHFGGEWKADPWNRSMIAHFGGLELHLALHFSQSHFTFFVARARTLEFGFRGHGKDWRALGDKILAELHREVALLPKGGQ